MDRNKKKTEQRQKRHWRVRRNVSGTPDKPRLCVYRSNKHIYAQVINDWTAETLTSASTVSDGITDEEEKSWTVEAARRVGELIGEKCVDNGIEKVVFDRGGFKYHGRVKALAEGARESFEEADVEGF